MNQTDFDGVYNQDVQHVILTHLLHDSEIFGSCRPILREEYFDDKLRPAARFILKYHDEFQRLPAHSLVQAKTGVAIATMTELNATMNEAWLIPEIEQFCKHRALENIMLESYNVIQKGDYAKIQEQVIAANQISLRSATELLPVLDTEAADEMQTSEFLIPDFLMQRQQGVLYAPHGSFKSFIGLDIGSRLARGMDWLGEPLQRCNVVYVAGEGAAMLKLRRRAWLMHHGLLVKNDGFFIVPKAVPLIDKQAVRYLCGRLRLVCGDIGLIILDTMSTMMAGQVETSSEAMTAYIDGGKMLIEEFGCAVLHAAHPGKDLSRGVRGHSSAEDNVDMVCEIVRPVCDGERANHAIGEVLKQKDGESGNKIRFTATKMLLNLNDSKGRALSSLVITPSYEPTGNRQRVETDRLQIALALMEGESALSLTKLAEVMKSHLGGKTTAKARLTAAVPFGQAVTVQLSETTRAILTHAKKNEQAHVISIDLLD